MYTSFAVVLVFFILGALFVLGNLLLGSFLRPRKPAHAKLTVYECGEPTIGSPWIRFNSRFYNVALVYLLFDVEVVLLLPVVLVLRDLDMAGAGVAALLGLLFFLGVLTLGLVYEWFHGNLDWLHQDREQREIAREEAERNATIGAALEEAS